MGSEVEKREVKSVQMRDNISNLLNKIIARLDKLEKRMATKEDVDKIEKRMATKEDVDKIEKRIEWLEFGFNTFRTVLSVSPPVRSGRPKNLSQRFAFAGDGVDSTRVTRCYESIL